MKRCWLRQHLAFLLLASLTLGGCASITQRAGQTLADRLSNGILAQDDPDLAADGIPAWLLLLDGFIQSEPENGAMLMAGARLYGAYAGGFVEEPERAQRLAARAYGYARRAACVDLPSLCRQLDAPFEQFDAALVQARPRDLPVLYALAAAWAGQLQTRSGDWQAIAELPKLEALFQRVVALDEGYAGGEPWMYLGVLASLRPASLGGQPEQGRADFERALALSGGRNQMVRVLYAQHYARLVFDRELHDRLLEEVIAADPHAPGLTLINVLAQQRARRLLASGEDYF